MFGGLTRDASAATIDTDGLSSGFPKNWTASRIRCNYASEDAQKAFKAIGKIGRMLRLAQGTRTSRSSQTTLSAACYSGVSPGSRQRRVSTYTDARWEAIAVSPSNGLLRGRDRILGRASGRLNHVFSPPQNFRFPGARIMAIGTSLQTSSSSEPGVAARIRRAKLAAKDSSGGISLESGQADRTDTTRSRSSGTPRSRFRIGLPKRSSSVTPPVPTGLRISTSQQGPELFNPLTFK